MLEEVAVGLILLAVGGLSYVAYRHPRGYRRMFMHLLGIGVGLAVILSLWSALPGWLLQAAWALLVCMVFLLLMPRVLGLKEPQQRQEDERAD